MVSWLLPLIVRPYTAGCKAYACSSFKTKQETGVSNRHVTSLMDGALTRPKQGPGVTLHHMWCTGGWKYMVALGGGWGDWEVGEVGIGGIFASYRGAHFPTLTSPF